MSWKKEKREKESVTEKQSLPHPSFLHFRSASAQNKTKQLVSFIKKQSKDEASFLLFDPNFLRGNVYSQSKDENVYTPLIQSEKCNTFLFPTKIRC